MKAYILKRPIITERSLTLASVGKYSFEVSLQANKDQIREVVESQFGVTVIGVNTSKVAGKRRRVGKQRREKIGTPWKKAIVQLKKGDKIDIFEVEQS